MLIKDSYVFPLKLLCAVLWVLCIVNVFMPFPGIWHQVALYLLYLLVGLHMLELLFFLPRMLRSDDNLFTALINSFLFGILFNQRYL